MPSQKASTLELAQATAMLLHPPKGATLLLS
jgi:hypothetical protein